MSDKLLIQKLRAFGVDITESLAKLAVQRINRPSFLYESSATGLPANGVDRWTPDQTNRARNPQIMPRRRAASERIL